MRLQKQFFLTLPLLLLCSTACSDDAGPGDSESSGGTASGGSSGGNASGGALTGGTSSGGAAAGGQPSGGTGGNAAGGATGATGGSGGAGETGGTGGEIATLDDGSPLLLSQTGLYQPDMVTLAEGVRSFEPRFPLWTDGATKRRWISIPAGEQIDTSDMDYWQFPTGTKLFKEFTRGETRVETRVLTKNARGGWQRAAYQWRADQMEADALVEAVENASGTPHDIPSQQDCGTCHFQTTDKILGFSAIQLAWDNPDPQAWTLSKLVNEGMLSEEPPALQVPGDQTAQEALGYMHANCGHCHNPKSSVLTRVTISLWLKTSALGSVEETPPYQNSVCQHIELEEGGVPNLDLIIDPGSPDTSALYQRFNSRGQTYSMPPLGTEDIHTAGADAIRAWIESLSSVTCQE